MAIGSRIALADKAIKALNPAPGGGRYEIADAVIGGRRLRVGPAADDAGKATGLSFVVLALWRGREQPDAARAGRRGRDQVGGGAQYV